MLAIASQDAAAAAAKTLQVLTLLSTDREQQFAKYGPGVETKKRRSHRRIRYVSNKGLGGKEGQHNDTDNKQLNLPAASTYS